MTRAVRVITEVAALDRPFDYEVTDAFGHVGLGDRVRVDLHHRSVRAWVVEEVDGYAGLKPLTKWLGYGPPPSLLALLGWASERWCGPWSRFLLGASPRRVVTALPPAPPSSPLATSVTAGALALEPGVWQVSPTTDPLALVLGAYEATRELPGSLLVLVPTEGWARRLAGRLEQRGLAVAHDQWERARADWPVVVGSRGAALAPLSRLCGAVVIDADDEAYRSSAAPTWEATALVRERCRRDGAALWATSMIPSPSLLDGGGYAKLGDFVGGWPRVEVVDRRNSDPREGVLSRVALDAAHRALEGAEPVAVAVILQRLGRGRLLACRRCGELARCGRCAQAEEEYGDQLACAERHEVRERFCRHCGATALRRVRVGVTTLARDVAAQLAQPVSEVSAALDASAPLARVTVGTEATFGRVRRCGVVVFVDFDQYLLAPRASARRSAVTAVAKAGRLVGARRDGRGAVILQTRRGEDAVVRALEHASFDALIDEDVETARLLGLAPFGANAEVSGAGAADFVARLDATLRVRETPEGYALWAPDHATMSVALRAIERPPHCRVALD